MIFQSYTAGGAYHSGGRTRNVCSCNDSQEKKYDIQSGFSKDVDQHIILPDLLLMKFGYVFPQEKMRTCTN